MTIRSKSVFPTLRSLALDTEPGACVLCQEPLPEVRFRRTHIICAADECRTAYQRIRMSDTRAEGREAANRTDYERAKRLIGEAMELLKTMKRRMVHVEAARRRE